MSSALLLLLGVTLTLPGLLCQLLRHNSVFNVSALPVQWTAEQEQCGSGEGCQDTLISLRTAMVVISKGCTKGEDHEARVTLHRTGPPLRVSYTHVCREADLCNDLSTAQCTGGGPRGAG
uniref:CD177 n=1 Tax=Microcebus murinus TaxID=30608 RepID=A0A8C5YD85_MICMU